MHLITIQWMLLKKATDKPLIIINESMQFSAGVNLSLHNGFCEQR
jgi:3-hydroxyacyl-CoA dehydrogenase